MATPGRTPAMPFICLSFRFEGDEALNDIDMPAHAPQCFGMHEDGRKKSICRRCQYREACNDFAEMRQRKMRDKIAKEIIAEQVAAAVALWREIVTERERNRRRRRLERRSKRGASSGLA